MSSFCKAMTKTFIGATLGAITSFVAERGMKGAQGKADFVDLALTGMHVGVNFISYPIALKLLSEACPEFKKNMQNPNGCKAITYIAGGLTGALLGTLAKYPLIKIAEIRKNGKTKCSGCEIVSNWVNSAGGAIGFAATNGTLSPLIPPAKNSLANWARGHFLVHISDLGATLLSFPVARIRYGANLGTMLQGWAKGRVGTTIIGDATPHFKNLLCFLD